MSDLSKSARDRLAQVVSRDEKGETKPDVLASCEKLTDEALVTQYLDVVDAIKGVVKSAYAERDAALSRATEAESARDLALSKAAPEKHSDLMLSMADSSLMVARDNAVARGLHAKTADALFDMLHESGKPNDLALSMAPKEPHPFGIRLFNVLTGMPAAPPIGKHYQSTPAPVAASNSADNNNQSGHRPTSPQELADIRAQFAGVPVVAEAK
jgi:hypothetical protein